MLDRTIHEPESALTAFKPMIDAQKGIQCRPIWKSKRIRSEKNKMLARSLRCANPDCNTSKSKAFAFEQVTDPHHIKTRGAGGGDEQANLCPLCRSCHEAAHRHEFTQAQMKEWALAAWHKTKKFLDDN